jgi:hypothetical protein
VYRRREILPTRIASGFNDFGTPSSGRYKGKVFDTTPTSSGCVLVVTKIVCENVGAALGGLDNVLIAAPYIWLVMKLVALSPKEVQASIDATRFVCAKCYCR